MGRSFFLIAMAGICLTSSGQASLSMDLLAQQESASSSASSSTSATAPAPVKTWQDVLDEKISSYTCQLPPYVSAATLKDLMQGSMEMCCHPEMPPQSAGQILEDFAGYFLETVDPKNNAKHTHLQTANEPFVVPKILTNPEELVSSYMDSKLGMNSLFFDKKSKTDSHFFENVFWMIQGLSREKLKVEWDLESKNPEYPLHKLIALAWPVMQHQQDYQSRRTTLACLKFLFDEKPEKTLTPIFKEHGKVLASIRPNVTVAQIFSRFPKARQTSKELVDLGMLEELLPFYLNSRENPEFFNQTPEELERFTWQLRAVTKDLGDSDQKKAANILTQFTEKERLQNILFIQGAIQFNRDRNFLNGDSFTTLSPKDRRTVLFWASHLFTVGDSLKLEDTSIYSTTYEGFYKFLSALEIESKSNYTQHLPRSENLVKASRGLAALAQVLLEKDEKDRALLLALIDPFDPKRLEEDARQLAQQPPAYESPYDKSLKVRADEMSLIATLPKALWTRDMLTKIRKIPHVHLSKIKFYFLEPLYKITPELRGPILDMILHGLSMPHMQNPKTLIELVCSKHEDLMKAPGEKS